MMWRWLVLLLLVGERAVGERPESAILSVDVRPAGTLVAGSRHSGHRESIEHKAAKQAEPGASLLQRIGVANHAIAVKPTSQPDEEESVAEENVVGQAVADLGAAEEKHARAELVSSSEEAKLIEECHAEVCKCKACNPGGRPCSDLDLNSVFIVKKGFAHNLDPKHSCELPGKCSEFSTIQAYLNVDGSKSRLGGDSFDGICCGASDSIDCFEVKLWIMLLGIFMNICCCCVLPGCCCFLVFKLTRSKPDLGGKPAPCGAVLAPAVSVVPPPSPASASTVLHRFLTPRPGADQHPVADSDFGVSDEQLNTLHEECAARERSESEEPTAPLSPVAGALPEEAKPPN